MFVFEAHDFATWDQRPCAARCTASSWVLTQLDLTTMVVVHSSYLRANVSRFVPAYRIAAWLTSPNSHFLKLPSAPCQRRPYFSERASTISDCDCDQSSRLMMPLIPVMAYTRLSGVTPMANMPNGLAFVSV